jgi:histone H3/H4
MVNNKAQVSAVHKKPASKRPRRLKQPSIYGISKPAMGRLAKLGKVNRMSRVVLPEIRDIIRINLKRVVRFGWICAEHAKRKTVNQEDLEFALSRTGRYIF